MIEILLLVIALSIDAFVASLAYGADRIKIPVRSAMALSIVSAFILLISMAGGSLISTLLPPYATTVLCFGLLFLLGISRFCEGLIKDFLKKHSNHVQGITFKFWDFHFILDIYMDNTRADQDHSKELSIKEALSLGIVLSLDGIAAGFGSGLVEVHYIETLILALLIGLFSILLGARIGEHIAQTTKWNISWLSGITLIILAFMKLF